MRACTIIDAPSDLGLRPTGVDRLPDALRAAGLLEGLGDARYAGRVPVPEYDATRSSETGVLNAPGIRTVSFALAERVAATLDLARFPLVLGGDCSILLGSMLALRRRGRFGLLFVDGHADFYSPDSEPAGEVASMDLAVVTGRGPAILTDLDGRRPLVRDEDVIVFGYRDAETAAQYGSPDVRQTGMHVFDLEDVRRRGAVEAAGEGISALARAGLDGFWIHLDADVLDDRVMPAVDYRMPDGLSPGDLGDALAVMLSSPLAVGLQITIFNPALDDAAQTAGRTLAGVVSGAFADAV